MRSNLGTIHASLRTAFASTFEAKGALDKYVARRYLHGLIPDSSWPDQYFDLDEEVIEARINQWLAEVDAPPLHAADDGWIPLDDLRRENRGALHQFIDRAALVVGAWEDANGGRRSDSFDHADCTR